MVAKAKTYGKKKGRDLASLFVDLSISPSKPGMKLSPHFLICGLADSDSHERSRANPSPHA